MMFWHNENAYHKRRGLPRRRVKPLWRRPTFTIGLLVCVLGSFTASSLWIVESGWLPQTREKIRSFIIESTAKNNFVVRKILVEGRVETSRNALLSALRLRRADPMLAFDLEAARLRVEALPWIQQVIIERRLPDVVHIFIEERSPMALWQRDGKFSLIDTTGEVVPLKNVKSFSNLIIIVGKDAPSNAADLLEVLATELKLASRVKAAVRVGGRRWNLHLTNGVKIQLPEKDANAAWSYLHELDSKYDLLKKKSITLDFRLADRLVIRDRHKNSMEEKLIKLPNLPRNSNQPNDQLDRQLNIPFKVSLN
jgi:cell division protein FtsQ